jgi:hypothetical protein
LLLEFGLVENCRIELIAQLRALLLTNAVHRVLILLLADLAACQPLRQRFR